MKTKSITLQDKAISLVFLKSKYRVNGAQGYPQLKFFRRFHLSSQEKRGVALLDYVTYKSTD
jgi:hypothetical protein